MKRCLWPMVFLAGLASAAGGEMIRFDFTQAHLPPRGATREVVTFEVDRCATPPQIDGRADDPAWQGGAVLSDFEMPEPATRIQFRYDDQALYVLVRCAGVPGTPPQGSPRPRDTVTKGEDQIHICLIPDPGRGAHYLLRLSVADAVSDAKDGDERWNGTWQHAVRAEGDDWTAELALPFSDFGLKSPPPRLGFNIGRSGPAVMIRSWYNFSHTSAGSSALILKGIPPRAKDKPPETQTATSEGLWVSGKALEVRLDRSYARPQDRWVDAILALSPRRPVGQTRLQAKLLDGSGERVLETVGTVPPSDYGRVSVDMRTHGLAQAELRVEYFEGEERTGMARMLLSAQSAEPLSAGLRIPVLLDIPATAGKLRAWPITLGVPFPAGALWDVSNLRMVNPAGREVPCQKEITGLWSENGSIQWVRMDALVSPEEGCLVEVAAATAAPSPAVTVTERDGRVILDTGVSRYVLSNALSPIEEIWLGAARLASCGGTRGLYVVDQSGRVASASADGARMGIEARGPVAASVRLEGFYRTAQGEPLARHITRVEAFAGLPFANVTHTLILTNDTNKVWFKEIGWELAAVPGNDPRGVFNALRDAPAKTVVTPLADSASAWMVQDDHTRFGGGRNHFAVTQNGRTLVEGEECGDWAMLAGGRGGVMVACSEAARQHPKEFELFRDRIVLKLFSNRAGEELDFRSPTLARKWNLQGAKAEQVAKMANNAVGWAKTHELRLSPVPAASAEADAARFAALRSAPIYACADPSWTARTLAMGPLHPRDPARFPEAEKAIDRVFKFWGARGHEPGHYGFADYFAGPTYGGSPSEGERYKYTYQLRSSVWLAHARSGDRAIRAFAEGTNKAYMDNYIAHWDAPGRERGLWCSNDNDRERFPFYWGDRRAFTLSSSTNLNQFIWLYHLTGYRRAKDVVESFADALKRAWKPGMDPRPIQAFRELTQCYGFTWDPALRALAEATFDAFSDSDTELLLTKMQYGSSTYKTSTDVRGLIEGWQLFGLPKYGETARRVSRFWWNDCLGTMPVTYNNPWGVAGAFLYEQTRDPAIPSALDFGLRRMATYEGGVGASYIAAFFEGAPYAMSVVARHGEDSLAPWVAYRDYGFPTSVVVFKGLEDALDLAVQTPGSESRRRVVHTPLKPEITLQVAGGWPAGMADWTGGDLHTIVQRSNGAASVRVPKDAPAGAYEIVPAEHGAHFVLAGKPTPMVLHAPKYWMLPDISPAARIYFSLPPVAADAQIFFEGKARLFDPEGQPFADPAGVQGWVNLPVDRPGLWRFEPIENRLVRGRNFPPFFAFGRPAFHFEPPIEWEKEPPARGAVQAVAQDSLFTDGAVAGKGNQALYLAGKKTLTFPAGAPHGAGDGGLFVPHREATIEFFFKPSWSTFDLGPGDVSRSLVQIMTDQRSHWSLVYRLDPKGVNINLSPQEPSHSLFGSMYLNDASRSWLRVWRTETLFERDEWAHIAWVWGMEDKAGPHKERLRLMTMRIYVNGRGKQWTIFREAGPAIPAGTPKSLVLGPFQGAVDELRVSDVQRYKGDFTPPPRDREMPLDEHTRALFHYNGDLKGMSHGNPGGVVAVIGE